MSDSVQSAGPFPPSAPTFVVCGGFLFIFFLIFDYLGEMAFYFFFFLKGDTCPCV